MRGKGFTLAELLIALSVLSVIATFTIPKVLTSTRVDTYNAMAKEAASTITSAYQLYRVDRNVTAAFNATELLPYLSTIKWDTTSVVQDSENNSPPFTRNCSDGYRNCYQVSNGGILVLFSGNNFGSVDPRNFIWIQFDPDGSGPAYSITFKLYMNGRILSQAQMVGGGSTYGWGSTSADYACPACDPSWWKRWQ